MKFEQKEATGRSIKYCARWAQIFENEAVQEEGFISNQPRKRRLESCSNF